MIMKLFFALLLLPVCALFGKTMVFTTGFNRPDFIELQYKLFEKFLEDDYQYIVISDANTPERRESIQGICDKLGILCYQVPQAIHDMPYLQRQPEDNYNNPNVRHCNSVQWAWDNYFSQHEGPVMIIDSDMFLIRPFSVAKTLENYHFAGVFWGTADIETGQPYSYLWLALILLNNPILPEKETICFNCGRLPNTQAICDSGGWTSLYIKKFEDSLKIKMFSYLQGHQFYCPYRYASEEAQTFDRFSNEEIYADLTRRGFAEAEINLILKKPNTIELLGDNHFLHYRAGSNYENYSNQFLADKDTILREFFDTLLQN